LAAAEKALDERAHRLFQAILSVVKSVEDERNDLAHGHWGLVVERKNVVTWIESKHLSPASAVLLNSRGDENYEELLQRAYVYRLRDIEDVYNRILDAWVMTLEFAELVRGNFRAEDEIVFDKLSNMPLVKRALADLDKKQRKR
jgi:hypothetical protein